MQLIDDIKKTLETYYEINLKHKKLFPNGESNPGRIGESDKS
jgi:hypothetical protein